MTCCHVANAFLSRLVVIWPISSLKISKCPKNVFLAKSSGSQWVNEALSRISVNAKQKYLELLQLSLAKVKEKSNDFNTSCFFQSNFTSFFNQLYLHYTNRFQQCDYDTKQLLQISIIFRSVGQIMTEAALKIKCYSLNCHSCLHMGHSC